MRALNLDQVRSLVAIADLGSFAAAAQALHLAPPTVSLHISELEQRLGATLLLRDKRGATPTAAGAVLIARGRVLLRDADDAVELVRRHADGRAGKLRLGTSPGVVVYLLPQVLERLKGRHPDIEIEVQVLGSLETVARLEAGTLDLGIVAAPVPAATPLTIRPWRRDSMVAWLPAGWDAPAQVTPQWLAARPLIANDSTTQMYRLTMAWFGAAGCSPTAKIELNYTEAMKSLVAAGYGAAVLPLEETEASHRQLLHERLQLRPLKPALHRELALAHRAPALLPAAAEAVLEVLEAFAAL